MNHHLKKIAAAHQTSIEHAEKARRLARAQGDVLVAMALTTTIDTLKTLKQAAIGAMRPEGRG